MRQRKVLLAAVAATAAMGIGWGAGAASAAPLTVTVTPAEGGTVFIRATRSRVSQVCPSECTAEIDDRDTITIRANPADGYELVAWGGDCASERVIPGGGDCRIPARGSAIAVSVQFAPSGDQPATPPAPPAATGAPTASEVETQVEVKNRMRKVVVKLKATAAGKATLRLLKAVKGKRTVVVKGTFSIKVGKNTLRLSVPASVAGGRYTLEVTPTTTNGKTKGATTTRTVTLPAAG